MVTIEDCSCLSIKKKGLSIGIPAMSHFLQLIYFFRYDLFVRSEDFKWYKLNLHGPRNSVSAIGLMPERLIGKRFEDIAWRTYASGSTMRTDGFYRDYVNLEMLGL